MMNRIEILYVVHLRLNGVNAVMSPWNVPTFA